MTPAFPDLPLGYFFSSATTAFSSGAMQFSCTICGSYLADRRWATCSRQALSSDSLCEVLYAVSRP